MTAFLVRRIFFGLFTLLVITAFVYSLARAMPGDPLQIDVEMDPKHRMSEEDRKLALAAYGLDKPWHVAYFEWLGRAVRFDLGDSFRYRRPVIRLILEALPATLLISVPSFLITFGGAIPLGMFVTRRSGSISERALSLVLYTLYSTPTFVLALALLYWFYLRLSGTFFQLPPGLHSTGFEEMTPLQKAGDLLRHTILPLFCYSYSSFAYDTRFIKANMEEAIRQDYVRTARAKGLDDRAILYRHAFRNTLIPFVTLVGLTLPSLITGAVILEQIFSWPGVGKLYYDAVFGQDYTLIMGLTLMFAAATLLAQLLADVLYAFVDPRVTHS
jgi:peptide/nickel transport system permease protein